MPFVLHPWANDARVTELKNSLRTHGVQLSSVLPLYKWSSPDEEEGQVAVRYWKRVIEITADLEYPLMNSEFNARSEPLPLFEREGIAGSTSTSRTPSTIRAPPGCGTTSTRPAPRPVSTSAWTSGRARSTGPRSSVRCGS